MKYPFSKIFIEENALTDEITKKVLLNYPNVVSETISHKEDLPALSLTEGKRTLWLTRFKGKFLKPCPGTADKYRCCNYLIINETTNCPIDCTYCILQGYINNPAVTIYTNYDQIIQELQQLSVLNPKRILRVGTGELTDSLALDPVIGLSSKLINSLVNTKNIILELKTKTNHIRHILNHNPHRVVMSWSVNPDAYVRSDEHKSAPLLLRLQAAQKAARKGFLIGLHFDPIIYLEDWAEQYRTLVQQISEHLEGHQRYPPQLKEMIQNRFPKNKILLAEQITGLDGKKRYLKPIRLEIYEKIVNSIREKLGNVFMYFCMESEDVWQKVLDKNPQDNQEIDWYFAEHLFQNFPELGLPEPHKENYGKPIRLPDCG
jgi:spore photoproduct lyase